MPKATNALAKAPTKKYFSPASPELAPLLGRATRT
jgi:hypothetical protein